MEVNWAAEMMVFRTTTDSFESFILLMGFEDNASAQAGHERITSFILDCFGSASSEPGLWTVTETPDYLGEGWGVPGLIATAGLTYFGTLDEVVVGDAIGISYLRAQPGVVREPIFVARDVVIRQMLVGLHGVPPE